MQKEFDAWNEKKKEIDTKMGEKRFIKPGQI